MVKNVKIFAPEPIEFDMTPLGLDTYTMPGDIPTGTVLRLMALEERLNTDEEEGFKEYRDTVIDLFKENHTKKELNKLRDKLGLVAINQIVYQLYDMIINSGNEAKNLMSRAREKARK